MTILFVIDSLGTGGAERSTADLWYFLRSKGIEPIIAVLRHRNEGIEKEILEAGFNVTFLKGKSILPQSIQLLKVIKRNNPDIVHSILFKSNLRTRFCRLGTKFIHIEGLVNCTYDPVRLRDPRISKLSFYAYKFLDRCTTRFVQKFLAITHTVKSHYIRELGIAETKISVLYRGRKNNPYLDERNRLRTLFYRELGLSEDTLIVLHVGRQEFQKGHLVLLSAIKSIEKNIDKSVAFVFLGRKGNSSPDIASFLDKNPLITKAFWLDHRLDVAQWMASADIFVFPSLYEGLGGVLIEAQAASLPIICSDIPVLHEVVSKNNALMFEVGNAEQLGLCLLDLIGNESKRLKMGKYSLQNFEEKFLSDNISNASLAFYQQLLK